MLSSLINVHVVQQLCTQTVLRQHTFYYFTEQTVATFLQKISRSILDLSTGISGISQINTIVPLVTSQNDFVCIDDDYVITTVNVRSEVGLYLLRKSFATLAQRRPNVWPSASTMTHSLFTVALFAEMVLKLKVSTA